MQGNLSDEEIAIEVVRQFFQAMIAKDFVKATKLYEGLSYEYAEKEFGKSNYLRIVSIGKPIPYKRGFRVPCTIEIEMDGKVIQGHPTTFVRQVRGQPRCWIISG